MRVKLIQIAGSDQSVANIAGISYNKELSSVDRLIPFLIKNGHHSPFEHTLLTFYVEVPIFVARQIMRHRIGFSWNEMSRRYVDSEPEFDVSWHGGEGDIDFPIAGLLADIKKMYVSLNKGGLKMREFARQILPVCTTTKIYMSCNIRSFWNFQVLRNSPHAQAETRQFAKLLLEELLKREEYSVSNKYFLETLKC